MASTKLRSSTTPYSLFLFPLSLESPSWYYYGKMWLKKRNNSLGTMGGGIRIKKVGTNNIIMWFYRWILDRYCTNNYVPARKIYGILLSHREPTFTTASHYRPIPMTIDKVRDISWNKKKAERPLKRALEEKNAFLSVIGDCKVYLKRPIALWA